MNKSYYPQNQDGDMTDDTLMQEIALYAKASNTTPEKLIKQIQEMNPKDQQKAIMQIRQAVQAMIQEQQTGAQYRGGGSTNSGNMWYRHGGDIPNYMKEGNAMYNFGGYFPQNIMFGDGGMSSYQYEGEVNIPAYANSPYMYTIAPSLYADNNPMKQYMQEGGLTVGTVLNDVNEEMLKKLTAEGYKFEIID
jgi:hypothetical protein